MDLRNGSAITPPGDSTRNDMATFHGDVTRTNRMTTPCTRDGMTVIKSRPAFEKLAIGPLMALSEAIAGGHYMDILRFRKQIVAGRQEVPSYWHLHKILVTENGYFGALYRGFMPWGLLQCAKGVPVLFVQNESMYQLQARAGWSANTAEKASGFLGGASQAFVCTPLQKVMVMVVASQSMNQLSPLEACRTIIQQNGFSSLFDGLFAMMLRRSLDWGIRWGIASEVKNYLLRQRQHEGKELSMFEMVGCGVAGGTMSVLTHPLDNIITNSQKPLPQGAGKDLASVALSMYRESGMRAFTRGLAVKVVDSAYHMAWMYGVGGIAYSRLRQAMEDPGVMKDSGGNIRMTTT